MWQSGTGEMKTSSLGATAKRAGVLSVARVDKAGKERVGVPRTRA